MHVSSRGLQYSASAASHLKPVGQRLLRPVLNSCSLRREAGIGWRSSPRRRCCDARTLEVPQRLQRHRAGLALPMDELRRANCALRPLQLRAAACRREVLRAGPGRRALRLGILQLAGRQADHVDAAAADAATGRIATLRRPSTAPKGRRQRRRATLAHVHVGARRRCRRHRWRRRRDQRRRTVRSGRSRRRHGRPPPTGRPSLNPDTAGYGRPRSGDGRPRQAHDRPRQATTGPRPATTGWGMVHSDACDSDNARQHDRRDESTTGPDSWGRMMAVALRGGPKCASEWWLTIGR